MLAIKKIIEDAQHSILLADDLSVLDQCRIRYLGKKGLITEQLKLLGQLPPSERPVAGQTINQAKELIQSYIEKRSFELKQQALKKELAQETLDVTLTGRTLSHGSGHPITKTIEHLSSIFSQMGFTILDGPEIEDDYHNFAALNMPEHHPARAMQDTFYFTNGKLLRTHMSTVEIRALNSLSLPLRMVAMGRVYRRDFDLTHTPMFHQMECQLIDHDVTFSQLKWLLQTFISEFFEFSVPIRFRPSYFPFTEPSAEVDIQCLNCSGSGCRICKQTGWLEILGCGMLHPNVLQMADVNPRQYKGLAFGAGIDRLTLLKYGISDLRLLFENDLRFLNQF